MAVARSLARRSLARPVGTVHTVTQWAGWVDIRDRYFPPSFGCCCDGGTHLCGTPSGPHYQYSPVVDMMRVRIVPPPRINRYGNGNGNNYDGHVCMYTLLGPMLLELPVGDARRTPGIADGLIDDVSNVVGHVGACRQRFNKLSKV